MGRPKLGAEYKKPSDYTYDYPVQREIAKHLFAEDKGFIAEKLGYSIAYIYNWCFGKRRNNAIMELASRFSEINKRCRMAKEKIAITNK